MLRTMPLSEQETTMRTSPVATSAETTEKTTTRAERRYDPKTIEAAVALASRMQAEHQETLSSEELEAIAAEAGIRPEFMRRALSLLAEGEKEIQTAPPVVKRAVRTRRTTGARRLTRRQKKLIFGYPLLYAILAFVPLIAAFSWIRHGPDGTGIVLMILLGMVLPGLLTVTLGANLSRKRQGAVAGAITGASIAFSFLLASLVAMEGPGGDFGGFIAAFAAMTGVGAFLGFSSAWLKQAMPFWLGADPADPIEEETETA